MSTDAANRLLIRLGGDNDCVRSYRPIRSPTSGRAKSYLGLQVDADVDADDRAGTPLVAQELVEVERALPVKASGQGGSRIGSPIGWG